MDSYTFSELITFSRTTNATLVDATGRVTYAPNNLVVRSEEFENAAWSKTNSAIAANVTAAPNGTLTADKHIPDAGVTMGTGATETRVQRSPTATIGVNYVFSIYAKASEYDQIELALIATPSVSARFSLTLGTVLSGTGATITDVGNGWYRCALPALAGATGALGVRWSAKSSTVLVGDGTSGIFAWGAQFEEVTYQTTPGTYNSTSPPNLFGFTEEFNNAYWTKAGATISPDATAAPNGSTTADKLVEDSSTGQHRFYATVANTTNTSSYTVSFFAKAAERTRIYVGVAESPTFVRQGNAVFNLSAGTVVSANTGSGGATGGSATIQDVGNGWYRCSYTLILGGANTSIFVDFNLVSTGTTISYTGNGNSGLFIWGAQLSNSASADPYVYNPGAAPTSTAYYGPRFDYNPATLAARGLLIEEQRVNLLLYSEQFDNAGWTKSSASVTANATTSPDGTANADRLTADGSLNNHVAQQTVTYTAAAHTLSVYAKKDTNDFVQVRFGVGASAQGFVNFDLNAGTVGTIGATVSSASITPAGNGWYRCAITATTAAVGSNAGFFIVASATSGSAESNTLTTSVFLYGAQLEVGSFATSYIPTVASTVTRAADNAVMSGSNFSSWYNQSEGTIVASVSTFAPTGSNILSFQDGAASATNRHQMSVNTAFTATVVGGVVQANIGTNANLSPNLAYAYATNNFAACANGAAVAVDTTGTVPTTLAYATLGRFDFGAAASLNGHIRSITFYPYRLADFQLQALTA